MDTRKSCTWLNILRFIGVAVLLLGAAGAPGPALARAAEQPSQAPLVAPLLETGAWVDADRDGLSDSFEDQLAKTYAPEVRLHHCEDKLPASVPWYLPRVKMGFDLPAPLVNDDILDTVTMSNLLTQVRTYNRPIMELRGTFYSSGLAQAANGQEAFQKTLYYLEHKGNLGDVQDTRAGQRDSNMYTAPAGGSRGAGYWPVYAHVRPSPASTHPGLIEIQYWFLYPRNGGLGYNDCQDAAGGQHEGDWEHITVRVSADGNTPHDAAYAAHGPSAWYDWSSLEKVAGTQRPVVYSAFHSHASYISAGKQAREDLPDDHTDNLGVVWDTSAMVQNIGERGLPRSGMEWVQYTGMWGGVQEAEVLGLYPDGPVGPAIKGVWEGVEAEDPDSHSGIDLTPPADQTTSAQVATTIPLGSFVDNYTSSGPWTVRALWGDGTYTTLTTSSTSGFSAVHTYSKAGGYEVSVYVTNGFTAGSGSFSVGVGCAPDSLQRGPSYTVNSSRSCDARCGIKECSLEEALRAAHWDGVPSTIELNGWTDVSPWETIYTRVTVNAHGNEIRGGPIQVDATGTLTITQAILYNPAMIDVFDARVIYNRGTVNLSNSTLRDNAPAFASTTYRGGAIINEGTMTIASCTLTGNSAGEGGAIYNQGTLTISASTLEQNDASKGYGGAIYNAGGGNLTIADSTFRFNNARSSGGGGAIHNLGNLTLRSSTLASNHADTPGGSGGGIYNSGSLNILSSTLYQNGAQTSGGGVYNSGTLTMLSSTLANNDAGAGPAIKNTGTATVKNTILRSKEPTDSYQKPAAPCSGTLAPGSIANVTNEELLQGVTSSCGTSAQVSSSGLLKLSTFAAWGGPTETMQPLPSGYTKPNPALDKGNADACMDPLLEKASDRYDDQRGYKRFADANGDYVLECDIGAVEFASAPQPPAAEDDFDPPVTLTFLAPEEPNGDNGWYQSVSAWTRFQDASDVIQVRCALDPATPPVTFADLPDEVCPFVVEGGAPVTIDGVHTLYSAAEDIHGNLGEVASTSFQLDATPPVVTCPAAGPFFLNSGNQAVGPAGVDASVSGLDEAASTLSGTISTATVGPKTVTFAARDLAGNSASQECSYNVIYDFGGYYPPVEPAPALNQVRADQVVPLKFSLAGDQGQEILADGYPTTQQVDCQTRAPLGDPSATKTAGKSDLSYDAETGWYNYVWKASKGWAGTCRALTIELIDGTQHLAYFQFR